ncbi:ABC transporter G family member 25 isoform X1 [Actinidia eriantha]|uniref:ABC transporter G family member 25 isoform X1 n=1 Tax=Actinidia eriantha TaxID=165200 RepID=UPI00258636A3|nr:ABC transporter G family member 25 isoform X1 [Actinidia eriantha]
MPAFRRDQETPNPDPEEPNDPSPPNSHDLQSIMSSCYPITLQFMDVCYNVKLETRNTGVKITHMLTGGPTGSITERTILNGITGMVSPGQILAVLGPSGSGKSTLLSALAGRLQGHGFTGSVLANGKKLTKPVLKRTGFVPQDDVLYPHLTVRETLIFISLLRLPNTLSKNEKTSIADSVISELGLGKCGNTIIGNSFIRGVSGGERKRVSIAHEMLINPSLLVLDEPTSGLDATAAHRLVATLGRMAEKGRRTVVMSVHQPSSRVYQMFNSALVLAEGRCIYFGKGSEAMAYFESVGFSPSFPMNPADFLLDLANGVCHVDGVTEREKPNVKQSLVASYNNLLAPKVKAACMDPANTTIQRDNTTKGTHISRESKGIKITTTISNWFHQFTILLRRSLKERRHEAFNSLRVFQVLAASMLAGSMWWRSDMRDVQDRLGLLFFISIFWGVLPSFNAVFAFPQERAIFMKERASGMYTLSPYFMARIVGDLPMELILPTIFIAITYWMTGLEPKLGSFLLTLIVLLGYVLASQGLGLALGALIMDAKQASTLVTVTMLAFVLTGGFYVHNVPACMVWMKYISTTFYCYRLLINVQYGEGKWISSLLGCSRHGSNHNHASCRFIEEDVEGQIHPVVSMGMLLFMLVGYRLLAYVALRRIKA